RCGATSEATEAPWSAGGLCFSPFKAVITQQMSGSGAFNEANGIPQNLKNRETVYWYSGIQTAIQTDTGHDFNGDAAQNTILSQFQQGPPSFTVLPDNLAGYD